MRPRTKATGYGLRGFPTQGTEQASRRLTPPVLRTPSTQISQTSRDTHRAGVKDQVSEWLRLLISNSGCQEAMEECLQNATVSGARVRHRRLQPASVKGDMLFRHAMSPKVTRHEPLSGTNWRINSPRTKKEEDTGPRTEGSSTRGRSRAIPGGPGDQARLEGPEHTGDLAKVTWRGHLMCPSVWRGN